MEIAFKVFVLIVAMLHFYFMVLESILWTKPLGLKTFRNSPEKAETTKVLAINQGVYNGFLSVGLVWGLCISNLTMVAYLLGCVVVAGIVGALTVSHRIFFVQSMPALIALGLLCTI